MGPASVIDFIATAPFEIPALVFAHLDNCHLKALRLTCKKLTNLVSPHLRFKRIFISASPLDVQVFRAIAEHETFRRDVREIVWDDARCEKPPPDFVTFEGEYDDECVYLDEYPGNSDDDDNYEPQKIPSENIEYLEERRGNDVKTLPQHVETFQQLDAQLPLDIAYAHYQGLLEQQEQVLSTSADVVAFEWALEKVRFPNLKRITLTPAAHGILFKPLYPTPAIRALPYGFNYPVPRGWPASRDEEGAGYKRWEREEDKDKWRGFRLGGATSKITELIFDGNQIHSGLTCGIFYAPEPCIEYNHLAAVIKKPGFTMLRLNLMVCGVDDNNYLAFRNGRLKQMDHFIPLRSILPVEAWKNLAHFGLSRFLIKQQDLLDFLAVLPQTLRSVELSFLMFMKNIGDYRELLFHIRNDLGWQGRAARPRLLIRDWVDRILGGRAIWLENELQEFLYNEGENQYVPSQAMRMRGPPGEDPAKPMVDNGFGMQKDEFEPRFERPFV
ncbi:hypothetical protein ColLi_00138 [Colletotrichum liriopes]|uniref:F-box domain-containing protein n=1 Tax=Colletotrichum liriopes TaxID=708192 RepID=A0AA37GAJ4_9PEZI|nr:hypothetical protein ColLi_00138 [Colletotrichum liriopes]